MGSSAKGIHDATQNMGRCHVELRNIKGLLRPHFSCILRQFVVELKESHWLEESVGKEPI